MRLSTLRGPRAVLLILYYLTSGPSAPQYCRDPCNRMEYPMPAILIHIINDFITLFVVVDPIAVLATFVALTSDCPPALKRKLAVQSILVAFIVMLFFIAFAQIII